MPVNNNYWHFNNQLFSPEFASFRVILELLKAPTHIFSNLTAESSDTTSTLVICWVVDVYYQVHWSLSLTAAS